MKLQVLRVVASYPEDLAKIINEGGHTKQKIFQCRQKSFILEEDVIKNFIAKEKSMPGFKDSKDRQTL